MRSGGKRHGFILGLRALRLINRSRRRGKAAGMQEQVIQSSKPRRDEEPFCLRPQNRLAGDILGQILQIGMIIFQTLK